jgi:regulator of nucleoside diphosphate kinase
MRGEAAVTIGRGQILVTEDDMARLRQLVRQGKMAPRYDQSHLEELDRELDRAEIIGAAKLPPDVVTMHSRVRVRDLDRGTTSVYTLAFPVDADIEKKRLSVLAPIGTALIGYRAGDRIKWLTPGGTKRLQIEEVLFQPEAGETSDSAAAQRRIESESLVASLLGRGPDRDSAM